jgi:hypothetical protein
MLARSTSSGISTPIPLRNSAEKLKDGTFMVTLKRNTDREYQFRYVIDDAIWENEWEADKYVASP